MVRRIVDLILRARRYVPNIRKAVAAGVSTGTAAYGWALTDGGVDGWEWAIVVAEGAGAALLTWAVANRAEADATAEPAG